ncbi:ferredoxin [Mycolicibacterium sp. XJ870]
MKVHVDDDRCRGHGVCVAVCPDVFVLTDDGYAQPQTPDVAAEFDASVAEAIDGCPEHAITLA